VDDKSHKNFVSLPSFLQLIISWCCDDRGINIYCKKNGQEKYPDFKLYKVIAKNVHKHTPHNQLKLDCFKQFIYSGSINGDDLIINIDSIPVFC
jgi:hypothetical protein